jgi:hypothetical protein
MAQEQRGPVEMVSRLARETEGSRYGKGENDTQRISRLGDEEGRDGEGDCLDKQDLACER